MKVTTEFLKSQMACVQGFAWFCDAFPNGGEHGEVVNKLIECDKWDWTRWLVVRLMTKPQKIEWAIFCAEQVIHIYEKKYPGDARPRNAIEAAKAYLRDQSEESRMAARKAAAAADAAAYAAYAADAAAYAAYADAYAAKNTIRKQLAQEAVAIISRGEQNKQRG